MHKHNPDCDNRLFFEDIELRAMQNDKKQNIISGLACPYDARSQLLFGVMYETLNKGCFTDSLRSDIYADINHNNDLILGRTKANTLTLTETERGIQFDVYVPDTSYGKDLLISVDRKDYAGCSIVFRSTDVDWGYAEGKELRIVKKGILKAVSIVGNPAYTQTEVYKRNVENMIEELREERVRKFKELNDIYRKRLDLLSYG